MAPGMALGSAAAIGCCAGTLLAGIAADVTAGIELADVAGVAMPALVVGPAAAAPAAALLVGVDIGADGAAAWPSGEAAPPHAQSQLAVTNEHHL
jgi:hypothetical protein